jgi:hypothetical protein
MTNFSGDKKVSLASGTQVLTTGTTLVLSTATEAEVAWSNNPMFYVIVTTTAAATGSVTITYYNKISDLQTGTTTITVPMSAYYNAPSNTYSGFVSIPTTGGFSTVGVVSITNSTNQSITAYSIGIAGNVMYW